MTVRLKADGATGKVAIYDYTTANDDPFTAPLSHVSRLLFHSDLQYPAIIDVRTGSITLPSVGTNTTERSVAYTLFAHGRGGVPYVEGAITSGLSRVVALCGSVPVQVGTSLGAAFPRVVHLGADATNVYLNEYGSTHETFAWGSVTLGWTVYVTDVLVA
jgi:hypothetical protein